MTDTIKKRIHLIYSIALSVLLVITGVCFMVACVGIYNSGDKPFSPEAVAAAFSGIAVPVYLCLALVIGGFILDGLLPAGKKKTTPEKQHSAILARLHAKLDITACDKTLLAQIHREQMLRRTVRYISLGLLAFSSVIFLIYALNGENFHQSEINGSMLNAMKVFIPCLAVPFGYSVFDAYFARGSILRETALVKQALVGASKAPAPAKPAKQGNGLLAVRCAILAVGIVILVYGFLAGGTNDVLTKAINICTECVGLG